MHTDFISSPLRSFDRLNVLSSSGQAFAPFAVNFRETLEDLKKFNGKVILK
jgi:hypothetical protein